MTAADGAASGSDVPSRGLLAESSHRLAGRAAGGVLSLVALRIAVSYFGAERWGVVAAAVAWTGIFALLGEFGIGTTTARDLAVAGPSHGSMLGATWLLAACGSVVGAAAAAALGALVYSRRPEILHLVWLLLPMFPFAVAWVVAATLLAAARRSDLRGLLDVLSSALLAAAAAVVATARLGETGYILGVVLATAMTGAAAAIALRRIDLPQVDWSGGRHAIRVRFRASAVVGVVSVTALAYRYVDTVLLSLLSSEREVGVYAVAYQLAGFVMAIPAFVLGAAIGRYVEATDEARGRLLQYLVDLLVGGVLPGAAVLVVAAHALVDLVGGAHLRAAVAPFELLIAATVLLFVAAPFASALVWSGNERAAARLTAAALVVNVAANLALDHADGARGAAVAMILSEAVSAALAVVAYCRRTGFRPRLRTPALAALAAAAVLGAWVAAGTP